MFSFRRTALTFQKETIETLLCSVELSEAQHESVNSKLDEIEEKYAILLSFLGEGEDKLSKEIIVACEEIERLAVQIRGLAASIDILKATQLYNLLVQPVNELKSQIQDRLTIEPFVLQSSRSRTQKLLATQSVVSRESARYALVLKEHLLNIRQLFYPGLSRDAQAEGPTCFISYAWPLYKYKEGEEYVQAFLRILHEHLRLAGIRVILDILDNTVGNSTHVFMRQAKSSDYVILILTQSLKDKHNDPKSRALHSELQLIREKHDADIIVFGKNFSRIFPVVVSGEIGLSNPPYLQMYSNVKDWREHHYLEDLKSFLYWIYIATSFRKVNDTLDKRYEALWREFTDRNPMPVLVTDQEVEEELKVGYHAELIKVVKSTQTYGDLAKESGEDFFDLDFRRDAMFTLISAADARFVVETRAQLDPVAGKKYIADEFELYISPFCRDPLSASSITPTQLLLEFVRDFFNNSSSKILLLQGHAGSGKTIFSYHLAHKLNTSQKDELQLPSDTIVILISLPSLIDPIHGAFDEYFLQKYGENAENEKRKLKLRNNVYFIFEAYDEIDVFQKDISQVKNLYTTNKMSEWSNAKFVFTCRSDFLHKMAEKFSDSSYRKFFTPVIFGKAKSDLFSEVQVAEFSPEQIDAYIDEYVRLGRHRFSPHQNNTWDERAYKRKIQELPNIREIIKNPLYLKMTVEALPIISAWHEARIRDGAEQFLKITERDVFLAYLKVNILRQEEKILQTVASSVPLENFRSKCISFLVRLCREMVKNQVYKVPYRFSRTEFDINRMNQGPEWATEFFGDPYFRGNKEQLEALESLRHNLTCFLTYEKGVWRFIHDAFRDRFDDLNIAELLHLKTQFMQEMDEARASAEAVDRFASILFDEALGPYYITKQNEWAGAKVEYNFPAVATAAASFFISSEVNIADSFIKASKDDNVRCDGEYQALVSMAVRDGLYLSRDRDGNTALHLAIKNFQLEKIKVILQAVKGLNAGAVAAIFNIKNFADETVLTCDEYIFNITDIGELFEDLKKLALQCKDYAVG